MNNPELAISRKKTLAYLAGWFFSILLSIVDLWFIQQAVIEIAIWVGTLRSAEEKIRDLSSGRVYGWTVETVSMTSLLVLLCGAVGFEIWVEYHYRRAATLKTLAQRELRISLIQGMVALIAILVTIII